VNIADHLPTSAPYLGQGYPISLKHVYCSHTGSTLIILYIYVIGRLFHFSFNNSFMCHVWPRHWGSQIKMWVIIWNQTYLYR